MTSSYLLHQLYLLRSQLELAIAMAEGATETAPEGPPPCPHPEDKRRQANNMGEAPFFICMACGASVPGVA